MRIALLSSLPVPLVFGGQDRLLEGLSHALRQHHPTDLVTIPVDERTREGVLKGYYDFYNLDLGAYDLVISYKAPSYMVRHPVHVLYLSHRMRVFYDLYEPLDPAHARMRRLIHWMDNWAMSSQRIPHIYCVGKTVSRRLRIWGGIPSTAIHHPTTFTADAPKPGEHFFAVGRLHAWKRFDLIIRAMRASKADAPLVIAGTGPDEENLRALAGGDSRIQFIGQVDEARLRDCYARAIATIFPPVNEDLGMVTFESFLSGKPVLTTLDAGEPAEIVKPGKTGFITPASPEAMAERLEWMAANRERVDGMREACQAHMSEITWERLTGHLLGAAEKIASQRGGPVSILKRDGNGTPEPETERRIQLLVTDNQIIDPPVGGGRLRIWELYRHLPDDFITTYIGLHDHPGPQARDQWLAPNFREIILPLTTVHFKMHEIWRRLTGGDATVDVTIPLLLGKCTPRYARLIEQHLPQADLLIYAHPWVFPFLPETPGVPRIYDSQNCEALLKLALLRRTIAGRHLARRVRQTEAAAIRAAQLTFAVSDTDMAQFEELYDVSRERMVAAPNGVDCLRIQPLGAALKPALRTRLGLPPAPLAVFIGSQYGPNMEAADYLVRELAPAVPGLTVGIIGGVGPAWRERNPQFPLPANVVLFGTVETERLDDLLRAADLGLNPMATGSGTNIKMLDFMAAGLAIVSTAVGARGLAGNPGEHWVETLPQEFPNAVRDVLASPDMLARLGERARLLAETQYDWAGISARLADSLRQLARSRGAGSAPVARP